MQPNTQRALWVAAIAQPLALEAWAVRGGKAGEERITFTRNTGDTFHTETTGGRHAFLFTWAGFALWFAWHIWTRGLKRARRGR